jgi:tRNA(fMet)-specific endonuclease VapC
VAVLIDTSVLVDVERRGRRLDEIAAGEDRLISVVTASELLHGVHRAADERLRARRHAFVEHVLARLDPVPVTTPVARVHAATWARLEAAGTPIGSHDLWIAATALAHGFRVVTANAREFARVPGLDVLVV